MTGFNAEHWPTEIKLKRAEKRLDVTFDDGSVFALPAEYLRVEGHSPAQKQLVSGARAVGIDRLEPVGHYAVRILFDDGHDTGIFSWAYLYELGRDQPVKWQHYLDALAAAGRSRDR